MAADAGIHGLLALEEIKAAVSGLSPEERARFRAWFEAFEAGADTERLQDQPAASSFADLANEPDLHSYCDGASVPPLSPTDSA